VGEEAKSVLAKAVNPTVPKRFPKGPSHPPTPTVEITPVGRGIKLYGDAERRAIG
jgi:hypothetical protein